MIDNEKSGRIKKIASLNRKKSRNEAGLFLVEGPLAVRELIDYKAQSVKEIFIDAESPGFLEIERRADELGIPINYATSKVLSMMSDTVNPQGIVAVSKIEETTLSEMLETGELAKAKLVAILHEVRDPGNAGAVIRAADAAGADAVFLTGNSIDPYNPKVVRSTTGSLFHLPVVSGITLEGTVSVLKKAGLKVIAADVNGQEMTGEEHALQDKIAWIFGNESQGLTQEERSHADQVLKLPIFGKAESLNLATAASVFLYTTAFYQRK